MRAIKLATFALKKEFRRHVFDEDTGNMVVFLLSLIGRVRSI